MLFEYDSSPIRSTVIVVVVIVIVSLMLPLTLFRLLGLSVAAGPAIWAWIQWRRRGHGVRLTDQMLIVEYPLVGRAARIPYVDILASTASADQGVIVAYLQRTVQSETGDYPAISRVALAQTRFPAGLRKRVASSPRLKDINGCLAALAQRYEPQPVGLANQFSDKVLRSAASGKNRRNILLLLLAVLATPIYVIIITRLLALIH